MRHSDFTHLHRCRTSLTTTDLNSLPLLGREIVEQAVDGRFTKMSQLLRAARARCQELSLPAAFVLEGENYVGSCLYEAARDYFAHQATDSSA